MFPSVKGEDGCNERNKKNGQATQVSCQVTLNLFTDHVHMYCVNEHVSSYCSGVKTLGSADDDEESAASWVVKMKSLAEEKKKAEKKVSLPSLSLFPPPFSFSFSYFLFFNHAYLIAELSLVVR